MSHPGEHPRLADEALRRLEAAVVQDLERDGHPGDPVARLVDPPHPAGPREPHDLEPIGDHPFHRHRARGSVAARLSGGMAG
jgi:hypothetical protein